MQRLIDLAREQTEATIRRLGELNRQYSAVSGKLDLLLQYREEYQQRFEAAVRTGLSQTEWQNFRNFIGKLDEAIAQQRQMQQESMRRVEEGRLAYREAHRKLKSFETLEARHEAREMVRSTRREQKDLDEISSNAYTRKLSGDL